MTSAPLQATLCGLLRRGIFCEYANFINKLCRPGDFSCATDAVTFLTSVWLLHAERYPRAGLGSSTGFRSMNACRVERGVGIAKDADVGQKEARRVWGHLRRASRDRGSAHVIVLVATRLKPRRAT